MFVVVDGVTLEISSDALRVKDNGISLAKLADIAALSVIGNPTNATADPAVMTAGTDGHVMRRSGTSVGFGTVANAGLATMPAKSVKVNNTNATATPTDMAASAADQVLQVNNGNTGLEFGQVRTGGLTNDAVTNPKLANMAGNTIKGAVSTGDPVDLTPAQVRAIISSDRTGSPPLITSANIGDGVAQAFTITHNWNTRAVLVQVIRNSGVYDEVECDIERTLNTVVVKTASVLTASAYTVILTGAPA